MHQPDEFLSSSWALKGGSADYHFIQQFSYQLKGQNQYFSYTILVKSYCQDLFFAMGLYFIIKLLWGALPTYVEQFMLWEKADMMMRQGGSVGDKHLPSVKFNKDQDATNIQSPLCWDIKILLKSFLCLTSVNSCMCSFDHSLVLGKKMEDDNLIISKLFNETLEFISPQKSNGIIDDYWIEVNEKYFSNSA